MECVAVLSVSESVESAMEFRMRVNHMVCIVSLTGVMQSATSVLLEKNSLGDLLVAHALARHTFDGEEFLCRSHHNARNMFVNTWDLKQIDAVKHGFGVLSQ